MIKQNEMLIHIGEIFFTLTWFKQAYMNLYNTPYAQKESSDFVYSNRGH